MPKVQSYNRISVRDQLKTTASTKATKPMASAAKPKKMAGATQIYGGKKKQSPYSSCS